jgi:hypothetical protein
MTENETTPGSNFIKTIIETDLKANKNNGRVATRFPPEPNGYLHIGHAKSICLNFGVANTYNGTCNLRFDDTNPTKEEVEYVDAIMADVRWLGFDWEDRLYYASDYFEQLYGFAVQLIQAGKAYVDDLNADEIREHRGTLTEPGTDSPWRNRSVEENLDLVRAHAGRRIRGRLPGAAGQDRHGPPQPDHARPHLVPYPQDQPPPDRRHLVHLSHVRLHPLPVRQHRRHYPQPVHPGVRKQPCLVRLGAGPCGCPLPPPTDRVRPAEPELHGAEQTQADSAGGRGACEMAGTIRACPPSAACDAAATPPKPSATSATASVWPSATAWWTWPCWNTPSAKTSTNARPGSWASCAP